MTRIVAARVAAFILDRLPPPAAKLLTRLDPVWGERKKARYDVLLHRHPFHDRGIFGN